MKTGDTVRDAQGRTFQVGQLLGRGLWGRTYSARDEATGSNWVLKVPHRASDLPDHDAGLAEACVEIALEQGRLLADSGCAALPRLECRLALPDGTPALVLPRANATLEQRLSGGAHLDELLGIMLGALDQLKALGGVQGFHGNLKPTNILVSDSGAVVLADPVTPAMRRVYPRLLAAARNAGQWCAPEVREATGSVPFGPPTDSYSLAMVLYRAAMASPGHERFPELPLDGLDKARLVSLKDRVMNRLKKEHSNPRFHTRLSDRLAALLNRALSRQTSPSPPYRFRRLDEMRQRLAEILAMVHPAVTDVGRLILDQRAGAGAFLTDGAVGFSCTVACSPGVEHHEEVACGLAIFDLDRDERLRLEDCSYAVDRHPSGRFRFGFTVGDLPPGGYRARVAFTIRESGDEPATAEGEFRVRAAPGYVPPRQDVVPEPISIEQARDPHSAGDVRVTEPGVPSERPAAVLTPASRLPGAGARHTDHGVRHTDHGVRHTDHGVRHPATMSHPERVRDPVSARSRPVAMRATTQAEDASDPRSAELPPPTPIAPFAPAERRPSRGRPAPRRAQAAVAVQATAEIFEDELSSPVEDRLMLDPERVVSRAPVERSRPAPLPGGPLPGIRNLPPTRLHDLPGRAPVASVATERVSREDTRPDTARRDAGRPTRPDVAHPHPGVSLSPAATRPEPAFRSVGRWTDLPLPVQEHDDLPRGPQPELPEITFEPDTHDVQVEQGPVGAMLARLVETVRSDAYVMFIGAAAVVILLLTVVLLATGT